MVVRKTAFIFILSGLIGILSGCGENSDGGGGRYKEETVDLPGAAKNVYTDIAQEGSSIRIGSMYGFDLLSTDGGVTFVRADKIPAVQRIQKDDLWDVVIAPDGSRVITRYEDGGIRYYLVTSTNQTFEITDPEGGAFALTFCYGGGYFYFRNDRKVYQVEPETGSVNLVMECPSSPLLMAANEDMLYVLHTSGLLLYDVKEKKTAEHQDEILKEFLGDGNRMFLYPYESGVYILAQGGLYRHERNGEMVEQIIDGAGYSLYDADNPYEGLVVVENEGGKDDFLVFYEDGSLKKYTYDADCDISEENCLCIFSVYEDENVRRAVGGFRASHPKLYVKYEVAIDASYAMTKEDALKNLGTEIAAGNGPDILVMDDIPYANYVEKGILLELSGIRKEMDGDYFDHVLDGFAGETGLYGMPMAFALPLVGAEPEWAFAFEEVESLSELADLLVRVREEKTDGAVFSFRKDDALTLLAEASMGAWLSEDRALDREAVAEFFVQAKRIYDVQAEGMMEKMTQNGWDNWNWNLEDCASSLERRFGLSIHYAEYDKIVGNFPDTPYFAGYLSSEFIFLNEYRKEIDGELFLMPGQKYGTCLPVGILAVNNASKHQEMAMEFLEYALSEEFQSDADLNGLPVNRGAYLARQVDPREAGLRSGIYTIDGTSFPNGEIWMLDIYWPTEEDFAVLDGLIEEIIGVNLCESKVFETVMENGQKVIEGSLGVEEAVDAVERDLQIYLAE